MSARFWGLITVIVVIFGGILIFSNRDKANNTGTQPTNHVVGTTKNNVTLVEYGDYECPVCARYFPIVQSVIAQYQDRIQFQFSNLPLSQVHQNAYASARAAEAAALQNQFWGMHDLLYENQSAWAQSSNPQSIFDQYAAQLHLNLSKFDSDFASQTVNGVINADLNAFNKTGAELATPTFFLNGKQVTPGPVVSDFQQLLDKALKK